MHYFSLRRKILLALVASTLLYTVAMIVFAQTVLRGKLVGKLQEKGVAIARRVALDSVNAMITERYFEVTMMLKDVQASEKDFVYAYVLDEEGRIAAHTFPDGVPAALLRANPAGPRGEGTVAELRTDRGQVLDIVVPLLGGQVGLLHLGLSEAGIRSDVNGIVLLITLFSLAALLLGGLAAVGFSRVITRPLLKLAGAAEAFGRGETGRPVSIRSADEVGELARVFNEMVESRQRAAGERERLIAELRQSLAEVKTLRGFLPICSSCKKIRSDAGYWQQIEHYLSEHTGAEFSHGLCPECAKSLYPEYWDRIRDAVDQADSAGAGGADAPALDHAAPAPPFSHDDNHDGEGKG